MFGLHCIIRKRSLKTPAKISDCCPYMIKTAEQKTAGRPIKKYLNGKIKTCLPECFITLYRKFFYNLILIQMKKQLLQIVTAVTLLFFTKVNFAQAPRLGTTADFVLFTSVGALGNTGISHLTGNVGTNSGDITIYVNVNGVVHSPDGATMKASADLLTLYTQLNTATSTMTHAPLLGGDTLTEGVYAVSADASLNDTLFLDARGDSAAVFIFQIKGTLSSGANAKVMLINGAQACNVFWKAEGAVTLAAGTTMRGTIVANNAQISLATGDTLEGRALSTAGAITANGVMAYTPTGCGSPVLTGPAAPDLASTDSFALFSGNGEVTNSGTTSVTGNVGTNVGLTTGFEALNVKGTIHPKPDDSTAAAYDDLLNVNTYLDTLPADITLVYPAQFGQNLVLTPHTYLLGAATMLTDTLYLNARGNPDAVFVIHIQGALSTSSKSRVILMNGTQAKNVFWKVDGAVDISDNSDFKGTIVGNKAISLKTGTTLDGRALTTVGALTTFAITAAIPAESTLPVTWLSFTAEKNTSSSILLKWSTASEINSHHFDVQRSSDGSSFATLGSVAAGKNPNTVQNYSYTEFKTVNGSNFYRLKQVDLDGHFRYSATVKIKMTSALWTLFPNPATSKTTIHIRSQLKDVSFTLVDNYGKTLYRRFLPNVNAGEFKEIPLSNLSKGIYILKIESDKGSNTEKIIVQ